MHSCSAGRTLPETLVSSPFLAGVTVALPVIVVSFPLFAGVLGGVRVCMTVLVRYAASLHGMAKLELWPLLVLNVLPSCICALFHLDLAWRSCLQVLIRSEQALISVAGSDNNSDSNDKDGDDDVALASVISLGLATSVSGSFANP